MTRILYLVMALAVATAGCDKKKPQPAKPASAPMRIKTVETHFHDPQASAVLYKHYSYDEQGRCTKIAVTDTGDNVRYDHQYEYKGNKVEETYSVSYSAGHMIRIFGYHYYFSSAYYPGAMPDSMIEINYRQHQQILYTPTWYQYNSNGEPVLSRYGASPGRLFSATSYVWQDGNLVRSTDTFFNPANNAQVTDVIEHIYTYDTKRLNTLKSTHPYREVFETSKNLLLVYAMRNKNVMSEVTNITYTYDDGRPVTGRDGLADYVYIYEPIP